MQSYNLIDYRKNSYSQFGEDGILSKILEEINIDNGWFVEFGAWDGEHLSNTKELEAHGWNGIFIEGDELKYRDLENNYSNKDKIITKNALVGSSGSNSLDNLLKSTPIPKDFDVLSIDIDGDDYHVWEGLKNYEPKVVIIESNWTFPYNVEFVQKENDNLGSSALSLYKLGLQKGYDLVCYNVQNCFFLKRGISHKLNLINSSFAYLFHIGREVSCGGFFASDYGGNWYWLYPESLGWGTRSIDFPNYLLKRGRYWKFLFISHINIIRQLFKSISKKKQMNENLVSKGKTFKIIDDSHGIASLFK